MDLLEEIKRRYSTFNKTRQRICDHILSAPEQCCFCSLRAFAQQVGTTEVTVLNFCRTLGLGSYLDLKKALQDYVISKVNPQKRFQLAVAGSDSAQDLCARVQRAQREALQLTFEGNDTEQLVAFNDRLRQARRVFLAGHDFSRVLATYLHRRLRFLGVDSYVLNLQDRGDVFNCLSHAPEESLLVAISVPPYGMETLSAARYCRAVGMPVAAITDRRDAPIAELADVSLFCHLELLGTTSSYTGLIGMIDMLTMLYPFLAERSGQPSDSRAEALRQQFDALFPN